MINIGNWIYLYVEKFVLEKFVTQHNQNCKACDNDDGNEDDPNSLNSVWENHTSNSQEQ